MARLVCDSCGYKMAEKGKIPQRCPYCSREGTMKKEKSAQDLLEEVDKNPSRYE